MATLIELERNGVLTLLDPGLGSREQEERRIYLSKRALEWLQNKLPQVGATWNTEVSPTEQLDALFYLFCSGQTITYDWRFKPLRSVELGIWELKTADIRLFGWFPIRDQFVASGIGVKRDIIAHKLYPGYIGECARFREQLNLDEPKFIPGDDPNVVVSNFDFP